MTQHIYVIIKIKTEKNEGKCVCECPSVCMCMWGGHWPRHLCIDEKLNGTNKNRQNNYKTAVKCSFRFQIFNSLKKVLWITRCCLFCINQNRKQRKVLGRQETSWYFYFYNNQTTSGAPPLHCVNLTVLRSCCNLERWWWLMSTVLWTPLPL